MVGVAGELGLYRQALGPRLLDDGLARARLGFVQSRDVVELDVLVERELERRRDVVGMVVVVIVVVIVAVVMVMVAAISAMLVVAVVRHLRSLGALCCGWLVLSWQLWCLLRCWRLLIGTET